MYRSELATRAVGPVRGLAWACNTHAPADTRPGRRPRFCGHVGDDATRRNHLSCNSHKSAQGDGSTERQHQRSEFCLLLRSPRLALLFIIIFNATQPPRIVAASILALCWLLTAQALALCGNVMRRRPSCRACTASRCCVLAGAAGWALLTDLATTSVLHGSRTQRPIVKVPTTLKP